jgi:FHA domain
LALPRRAIPLSGNQIEPIPGGHLVAVKKGAVIAVAHRDGSKLDSSSTSAATATALLRIVGEATSLAGEFFGETFTRLVDRWSKDQSDDVEFACIAPATTGISIYLRGEVGVSVAHAKGAEDLLGLKGAPFVDLIPLSGGRAAVFVKEPGSDMAIPTRRGIGSLVEGVAMAQGAVVWMAADAAANMAKTPDPGPGTSPMPPMPEAIKPPEPDPIKPDPIKVADPVKVPQPVKPDPIKAPDPVRPDPVPPVPKASLGPLGPLVPLDKFGPSGPPGSIGNQGTLPGIIAFPSPDAFPDLRPPKVFESFHEDDKPPPPRPPLPPVREEPPPPPRPIPPLSVPEPRPNPPDPRAALPNDRRVHGVLCVLGHINDPVAAFCRVCGKRMDHTKIIVEGERPALGVLVVDDGSAIVLHGNCVFGREPERSESAHRGATPIRLADQSGQMSRAHAEVRLVGWEVEVVDLASTNGTFVRLPGDPPPPAPPRRLVAGNAIMLVPGAEVTIGSRVLKFDSANARI